MADLIILNGTVWTADKKHPRAEALAVKGDKIIAVGSSREIIKKKNKETTLIELKGESVLPGFIDCHTHFIEGALSLSNVNLRKAASRQEFVSTVKKSISKAAQGKWILNGNWNEQNFDVPELPHKEWIDGISSQNPVCLTRHDQHMILANNRALKMADITKDTPSPPGGEIQKDKTTGEPTGILKDSAMELVMKNIPEPSMNDKMLAVEKAQKYAAEVGVTSLHDMEYSSNLPVYQELLKKNKLDVRIMIYLPIIESELFSKLKIKTPFGNKFIKIGGLKGFIDGSLGSSTALFFEPYEDDSANKGIFSQQMFPEGTMEDRIVTADRNQVQVAIHAIGDRANHMVLDMFEKANSKNQKYDRRWRIEHAQHIIPEDIQRFSDLNVIASVQPYHLAFDGSWAENKIGKRRSRYTYALKSLINNGVKLAFGTDWPVVPLNPLEGIQTAVTRQTKGGSHSQGWIPEEKISLEDALRAYTINGAYTEYSENVKGSIEPGKLADIAVLSKNVFEAPLREIAGIKVNMTIFDGKILYPS